MKRSMQKGASLLLMVMMLALVVTACGGNNGKNKGANGGEATQGADSGSGKKTELLFWSPFSGSDGPFMKKSLINTTAPRINTK